jgi:hypothetical protein
VTQRAITITADAVSRVYGNANPALTYTVGGSGLVNGDRLSGSLDTKALGTSPPGEYAINQGSLAASDSYSLSFVSALLTVRVSTPSSGLFGTTFGGDDSGSAAPRSRSRLQPVVAGGQSPNQFSGFVSLGYESPAPCVAGRVCSDL